MKLEMHDNYPVAPQAAVVKASAVGQSHGAAIRTARVATGRFTAKVCRVSWAYARNIAKSA